MKEETRNLKNSTVNQRFQTIYKTKLSYCLQGRNNTESKSPKIKKAKKNRRITLSSNCAVYNSKKSRFIKEQEASRLLSSLGMKTRSSYFGSFFTLRV